MLHGASIAVSNISEALARQGHEVIVISKTDRVVHASGNKRRVEFQGFAVPKDDKLVSILGMLFKASIVSIRRKPSIVHAHGTVPGVVATALHVVLGVPFIVSFHQDDFSDWTTRKDISGRLLLHFRRLIANTASAVQIPSSSIREKLRTTLRVSDEKIFTIPHPVSQEFTAETQKMVASRNPYVLCVGLLMFRKGIDTLLRALPEVIIGHTYLKLVVVGEGHERANLENLAAGLGLTGSVKFEGVVSDEQLINLYRGCMVYVHPARSEMFGLALAQAMFLGRPCIATATSGAKSMIEDGVNGILVGIDDYKGIARSLVRLIDHSGEAAKIGVKAREWASQTIGPESVAAGYEALFLRINHRGHLAISRDKAH